jgi:hypothetical protein
MAPPGAGAGHHINRLDGFTPGPMFGRNFFARIIVGDGGCLHEKGLIPRLVNVMIG